MKALRALWWTSRPVSWINTAYPFAAAYFIVAQSVDWPFILGTLFFLIPYNLAMYGVNDVFDYESDLRNPRKGGVEGALLEPRFHRLTIWVSIASVLPGLVILLLWGTLASGVTLVVALVSLVAYSVPPFRTKEIAVLDSVTSSAHFVLTALFGVFFAGGSLSTTGALVLAAFFLWGMASHAFGAVQDVEFDRAAGIGSIATAIGARRAVWCALALYMLSGALLLATPWPLPLLALAILLYLAAVGPFATITDQTAELANKGWRWFMVANVATGAVATIVAINAGYLPG